MIIRPAVESDLAQLLELYAELHRADPPIPLDAARGIWRQIDAQAGRTILVAVVEARVAGTVDCAVLPNLTRGGRPFVLVENVVVSATCRRSGIGARLLDAVAILARSAGCYKIQLMTGSVRTGAHPFYEAQGFQAIAQGYRLYLD